MISRLLFLLLVQFSFSQTKPAFMPVRSKDEVLTELNRNTYNSAKKAEEVRSKTFVVDGGTFYPISYLEQKGHLENKSVDIIKIPDSISKDIRALIVLKPLPVSKE